MSPRRAGFIVVTVSWLLTLAVNAPGHLSYDSITQLNEGRSKVFAGAHPPLMSLLMGWFDALLPGTALYLLVTTALCFGAFYLLIASAPTVRWATVLVLLAAAASPLILIYQGIIWKDVLFANLSIFAFCLVIVGAEQHNFCRGGLFTLALAVAGTAAQVRQNGLFVPLFCGAAVIWIERSQRLRHRSALVCGLIAGALGLAAFGAVGFLSTQYLNLSAKGQPDSSLNWGLRVIARYDIAGMLANGAVSTGALSKYGVQVEVARADAKQHYSPERIDFLSAGLRYAAEVDKIPPNNLHRVWLSLVEQNLGAYLSHREEVLRWMIWPPDVKQCLPVHIGVSGPPELMTSLLLPEGSRPSDRVLYAYAQPFFATPLFLHGTYLAGSICLLIVLWRAKSARSKVGICLLLSSISFALSFGLIGLACDFRYLYFVPLSFTIALLIISSESFGGQETYYGGTFSRL